MLATQRIYRTVDGGLVRENDTRGAFLAYPVGAEIKASEVAAYEALVAGEATSAHEVPGLMHDGLATQVADAQRVIANAAPDSPAAAAATEVLDEAAELVDAASIPAPARLAQPASPVGIVREHAVVDERPVTDRQWYRTADGVLVPAGHADAAVLAYGEGDRVERADQEAYGRLLEEAGAKPAPARKATKRASTKAAAKPADKAAATPDDKSA